MAGRFDDPALTIHVEMMPDHAFYYFGKEPGAGENLPTGTSGRRGLPAVGRHRFAGRRLADDAPGLRGTHLAIHFHSYPILLRASQEKVREIATQLTRYHHRSRGFRCRSASFSSRSCWRCRPIARGRVSPLDAAHRREAGPTMAAPRRS